MEEISKYTLQQKKIIIILKVIQANKTNTYLMKKIA